MISSGGLYGKQSGIRLAVLSFFLLNIIIFCMLHLVKYRNSWSGVFRGLTDDYVLNKNSDDDHKQFDDAIRAVLQTAEKSLDEARRNTTNTRTRNSEEMEDHKFKTFFRHPKTLKFIKRYHTACHRRIDHGNRKTFSFVFNTATWNGFGSIINNALNAYLIAQDRHIDRSFSFMEIPWFHLHYTPLSQFFHDFANDTACPIFTKPATISSADVSLSVPFLVQLDNSTCKIRMSGSSQAVMHYGGPGWRDIYAVAVGLVKRDGIRKVFAIKSAFFRALWHPKPNLKKFLKFLWRKAIGTSGSYISVHLRRGDKLTSGEMMNIPVGRYVAALHGMYLGQNFTNQRNIFIMHDEPAAFREFTAKLGNHFRVFQLSDLLGESGFDGVRDLILNGQRGGDVAAWHRHSRELILSLTLMAMSDQVICTFSSNLCRIVALIKGDLASFQSLDKKWNAL